MYTNTDSPVLFLPTSTIGSDSTIFTSLPLISSDSPMLSPIFTTGSDDLLDSPILSSVNLTYSTPLFGYYQNLNTDPKLHKRMIKHFYFYKFFGDWIYDELLYLLNYFTIDGNKQVNIIKSLSNYDRNTVDKDSDDDIELKIEYLKKNIFKQKNMAFIVHTFVQDTNINWYDLTKKEKYIRKNVSRYLKKKISKIIEKNK